MELVVNLHRAALENRQKERLDQAESVALGIAEAFNPEAGLLAKLRKALSRTTGGASGKLQPREEGQFSLSALAFFAGIPWKAR